MSNKERARTAYIEEQLAFILNSLDKITGVVHLLIVALRQHDTLKAEESSSLIARLFNMQQNELR